MNERGQILLPGLAWFLGMLAIFSGLVAWGRTQLSQEQMDMAAAAAALSAARALASQLNECATQNVEANGFVNLRFEEFGAMESAMVPEFEDWLELHELQRGVGNFQSVLNGFKGNAAAIGSQVAKFNGAKTNNRLSSLDLRLNLKDLDVIIFYGIYPAPAPVTFSHVYYTRMWGYGERKAQPPHQVIWSVSDGRTSAAAAARVYLDVRPDEPFQNGGFPREQGEDAIGDFEIQSQYPQFNAKLVPAPLVSRLVSGLIS